MNLCEQPKPLRNNLKSNKTWVAKADYQWSVNDRENPATKTPPMISWMASLIRHIPWPFCWLTGPAVPLN